MLERLRQSLALRLAAQYALVFALTSGVLFSILYWTLSRSLLEREQVAVERQAALFALALETGGTNALRARIESTSASPEVRSFYVRVLNPAGETLFASLPPNWVETQVERLTLPPEWNGVTAERRILTERIPKDALRDYVRTVRELPGGFSMQVGRLADSSAVLLAPLRRAFITAGSGALLLSFGVGILLAWRATRPLRAVSQTARRILETGDLAARVPATGAGGELATLVSQLNTLLDKNAAHVRVLRETLDNLAHDLRTPLTRLRGTAELAMQDAGDPAEARAALADCVNESDRVLHLLEVLLDISAAEAGALKLNRDQLDVRTLVERAADLYREVAEEKNIRIVVDQPVAAECQADAIRLGQAVNNLVDNALKYTPPGGIVKLTTTVEPSAVVITVSDNGPGIPATEREAVWRRLYRGDSSRSQRGLGLGLSLVKAIVEAHGGTAAITDAHPTGAKFTIRLPK